MYYQFTKGYFIEYLPLQILILRSARFKKSTSLLDLNDLRFLFRLDSEKELPINNYPDSWRP